MHSWRSCVGNDAGAAAGLVYQQGLARKRWSHRMDAWLYRFEVGQYNSRHAVAVRMR